MRPALRSRRRCSHEARTDRVLGAMVYGNSSHVACRKWLLGTRARRRRFLLGGRARVRPVRRTYGGTLRVALDRLTQGQRGVKHPLAFTHVLDAPYVACDLSWMR